MAFFTKKQKQKKVGKAQTLDQVHTSNHKSLENARRN
jgi:hypothetical protein